MPKEPEIEADLAGTTPAANGTPRFRAKKRKISAFTATMAGTSAIARDPK